jgi:hypothetical protein
MYGSLTEWVELDFNGNITGRWRLDAFHYDLRVAFTSDSHVFIQYFDGATKARRLLTLDRATSAWQPVPSAPAGELVSADADALIFRDLITGPIHLRWYPHP